MGPALVQSLRSTGQQRRDRTLGSAGGPPAARARQHERALEQTFGIGSIPPEHSTIQRRSALVRADRLPLSTAGGPPALPASWGRLADELEGVGILATVSRFRLHFQLGLAGLLGSRARDPHWDR